MTLMATDTRTQYAVKATEGKHGKWQVAIETIPGHESDRAWTQRIVEERREWQASVGLTPDAELVCRSWNGRGWSVWRTAPMNSTVVHDGDLARVLELLEGDEQLLHPDGDLFGTTRQDMGDGVVLFAGNFWERSYAFRVETDQPEMIARLDQAIDKQRAREAYAQAVVENREHHAAWGYNPA